MRQRTTQKVMAMGAFIFSLLFWQFSRLQGSDCIRAIHIVTLLAAGIGIGVFITGVKAWFTERKKTKEL